MLTKKEKIIVFVFSLFFLLLFWFSLPSRLFNDPISIVIEDNYNHLLGAHIATDGQWRFPESQKINRKFAMALIIFEDRRFIYHMGFDPFALIRAAYLNIKFGKKISGGSTLTMQLIRLSRKGKPRTIIEKAIEIYLALRLETNYSKNKILTLYASHAPYGGNVVGLDAASWIYFGRSQEKLSWSECAMLAVLPNAPSLIHPSKNRNLLKNKRDRLLKKMFLSHFIDRETYELSIAEPVPMKLNELPSEAPYLLDRIYLNYKQNDGDISVFKTTIDVNLQKMSNDVLQRHMNNTLKGNGIQNAAVFIINNRTNEIPVYIGNICNGNDKNNGCNVDIITSPRSTGSILKPFLYAAMLSSGDILPNALVPDIPTQISGYAPKNFNLGYDGAVPAKRALARSLNIPAIRMLQNFGVTKFIHILKKCGLTTINRSADNYGLSLILGGCEGKLEELCSVYSSMARTLINYRTNSSKYNPDDLKMPVFLKSDKKNKKWNLNFLEKTSVFTASSIWFAFNSMVDVDRPPDESNWEYFSTTKKIAWKTGTSFGFRDGWAIGVTPDYTVGVWVGNADGEGRPSLTGINCAAPIMFDIFSLLPQNTRWFEAPYNDMMTAKICHKSGYLASDICNETDSVWIPKSGINYLKCPYHKLVHLDATSTWRVHSNCEDPGNMQHVSWFVLPPVMEVYYKSHNYDYKTLPDYRSDCLGNLLSNSTKPMEIIYPRELSKIYVPLELDGKKGSVVFEVAHRKPEITIFWYIDNKMVGTTKRFHHIALQPNKGKHVLTLVDENGDKIEQTFEIIEKNKH